MKRIVNNKLTPKFIPTVWCSQGIQRTEKNNVHRRDCEKKRGNIENN